MSHRHLTALLIVCSLVGAALAYTFAKRTSPQENYPITRVAVSRSGRWIAVASKSGWIGIIDHMQPDNPQRFRTEYGEVQDLRFSPDEEWLTIVTPHQLWRHPAKILGSTEAVPVGQDTSEAQPKADAPSAVDRSEITSNVVIGPEPGKVLFGNFAGSVEVHEQSGKLLERFMFR